MGKVDKEKIVCIRLTKKQIVMIKSIEFIAKVVF
jgi:hypothetical protein